MLRKSMWFRSLAVKLAAGIVLTGILSACDSPTDVKNPVSDSLPVLAPSPIAARMTIKVLNSAGCGLYAVPQSWVDVPNWSVNQYQLSSTFPVQTESRGNHDPVYLMVRDCTSRGVVPKQGTVATLTYLGALRRDLSTSDSTIVRVDPPTLVIARTLQTQTCNSNGCAWDQPVTDFFKNSAGGETYNPIVPAVTFRVSPGTTSWSSFGMYGFPLYCQKVNGRTTRFTAPSIGLHAEGYDLYLSYQVWSSSDLGKIVVEITCDAPTAAARPHALPTPAVP